MAFKSLYTEEHENVVKKIIKARLDANLTQEEVAKKLGRTQSYLSKTESGQRKIDIPLLKQLAEIYQKPLKYFL